MGLGRQGAERHAARQKTPADAGDGFHVFHGDRLAEGAEIQQIAQIDRRQVRDPPAVFPVELIGITGHRALQHVDQLGRESMSLTAHAITVEIADRQRRLIIAAIRAVLFEYLALNTGHADARDTRRHARENIGDQGARQADGLEIIAAPIGAHHRDADLRHDLEQPLIGGPLVPSDGVLEREPAHQAAAMAVDDAVLGEIGIDRGRADADQHGEIMHIQAFGGTDVERGVGTQAVAHQMGVNRARRQDHRYRRAILADMGIIEDEMDAAAAHRVLGLAADAVDRVAQGVFIAIGGKAAIDAGGAVPHALAHVDEIGVGQDRR